MERPAAENFSPRPEFTFGEEGKELLETLKEKNVAAMDLQFSEEEKEAIRQFQITNDIDFEVYDFGEGNLVLSLKTQLEEIGVNEPEVVLELARIIAKRAEGFKDLLAKEALNITVRATLPHEYNDIPRWHDDGMYFTQEPDEKVYKMVFPVIGAKTLFGEVLDKEKYDALLQQSFTNHRMNLSEEDAWEEDLRIRKELDAVVKPISVTTKEQAAVFLVGHNEATIHSEPPVSEPRIFVAVLVGSKEQIREMI